MYKIIADFGDYQVIDERIQTFNTEREPRTVMYELGFVMALVFIVSFILIIGCN